MEVVWIPLALVLAVAGTFAVALAVAGRRDFDELRQVVPGIDSKAPSSWAGSHTPEARLHRRLRDAVTAAHTAADIAEVSLVDATSRIDAEAIAVDNRLVAMAALPVSVRSEAVARLEPLVASLEETVASLAERVTATGSSAELLKDALDDADVALQALTEAREEIERIDRGDGA